jgi:hypothetical protein
MSRATSLIKFCVPTLSFAFGGDSIFKRWMALLAVTAILSSSPSYALTFDFSFTNTVGNVSGTVTGEIVGLADNSTSAATNVIIDSYPAGIGLGLATPFDAVTTASGVPDNAFTVTSGLITSYLFESYSFFNWTLCMGPCSPTAFLQNDAINSDFSGFFVGTNDPVTFTPVTNTTPLPAALPLFASGLGALGLLGWRRKRKASALAAA